MGSFTEADVRAIALAAYRAGFDGPMELADAVVIEIVREHLKERSDGKLLSTMPLFTPSNDCLDMEDEYDNYSGYGGNYSPGYPSDD
jgi:hypothetical protein